MLVFGSKKKIRFQILNELVTSGNRVQQLDTHIEVAKSFDYHIEQLCKKDSKKLHALSRVTKSIDISAKDIDDMLGSLKVAGWKQ